MTRLREVLFPDHVLLNINADSLREAIAQLTETLKSDARIISWRQFSLALLGGDDGAKLGEGHGFALPHVRTKMVAEMVTAFGRLAKPVHDEEGPIYFIVLIGIPETMDAEYPRLLGFLMRVLRDAQLRAQLMSANDPEEVFEVFEQGETTLAN
ncbi:MAG: PTS sugar transporter subunit IIA [Verrucomicrobia bacterium]|nr:PTS sugar transporter subunit IIA [Verrucomicrobiota bacterium]